MTRTRRFLGGLGFGVAGTVLVTVAGLWLTPFFLDRLGQQDFGRWLVVLQVAAYLGLLDLGVVALLPRDTAIVTGRPGDREGDAPELQQVIARAMGLVGWQAPLVLVLAAAGWIALPDRWPDVQGPLRVILVGFAVCFPLRIFPAVLQGLQELPFLGRMQIASWLTTTIVSVVLVTAGFGLYALAIGWVVGQAAMYLAAWRRVTSRLPQVLPPLLPSLRQRPALDYVRRALWISAAQIAQVLLHGTDILIIGRFLGAAAIVPYACTGKLIAVLANQPQMLMQTAAPALSQLRGSEAVDRLFAVATALTQAVLLGSGLLVCVILAVNGGFVAWWVGADQYAGVSLTALLLAAMLLRHWNTTGVYTLFCFGFERRLAMIALFDGIVTAAAALVLVPRIGLAGGPLASMIGSTLVTLPATRLALARVNGPRARDLAAAAWPWFWRCALTAVLAWTVCALRPPQGPAQLALAAMLMTLVYLAVMTPVVMGSTLGSYVRPYLEFAAARWMRPAIARLVPR
jgi:O-antigen/teichoic acid export membrane protein